MVLLFVFASRRLSQEGQSVLTLTGDERIYTGRRCLPVCVWGRLRRDIFQDFIARVHAELRDDRRKQEEPADQQKRS